jgi:hypothetical protein
MQLVENEGGHPQNEISARGGVSLTRPESTFLETLTDPLLDADTSALYQAGRACGLRPKDVDYIVEWVNNHGSHLLACDDARLNASQGAQVFRNPIVRKIINAAADKGFCLPTSAMKEEIEDFLSQQMRNPFVPDSLRESAADKLAKLKGYTDTKSAGGTAIQIVVGDPYAGQGVIINGGQNS